MLGVIREDPVEFWFCHTVDALGYDKFYNGQEYIIAEKYLNTISTPLSPKNGKKQSRKCRSASPN